MRATLHWSERGGLDKKEVAEFPKINNFIELYAHLNEHRFVEVVFEADVLPTLLNVGCISSVENEHADPIRLPLE